MAVASARVRAQFEEAFGFPPPAVLVERGLVDPRKKSIFLPPLDKMLSAKNAFEAVLDHCAYRETVWPVHQLMTGCFELTNELIFVHVMPDGGERVVWWDRFDGFSRPVATDARLYMAADDAFRRWHQNKQVAPFVRAVDAARDVCDWPEWPPVEWVETFGWTEDVAKLGALPPLPRAAFRAEERLKRGLWLAELLVGAERTDKEHEPTPAEERATPPARIPDYMPDIIYWLWHSAAYGDDETRRRVIARAESSRSRLARDAGRTLLERMLRVEAQKKEQRATQRRKAAAKKQAATKRAAKKPAATKRAAKKGG